MKTIDAYFAFSAEQTDGYWAGICDGINLNSAVLCEFEDTSGRQGFPPSKWFPVQDKKPEYKKEAAPFHDSAGVFDKIPDHLQDKMAGFNKVKIVHARIRETLVERAQSIPEFIGLTREDVFEAFPDLDGTKTIEYTDPDTGETVTREEPLLPRHEWR